MTGAELTAIAAGTAKIGAIFVLCLIVNVAVRVMFLAAERLYTTKSRRNRS